MHALPRFAHRGKAGDLRRRQAAYFKNVINLFGLFNYYNSHSVCADITLNRQYLMKIISKILQPAICKSLVPISMFATVGVVSPLTEVIQVCCITIFVMQILHVLVVPSHEFYNYSNLHFAVLCQRRPKLRPILTGPRDAMLELIRVRRTCKIKKRSVCQWVYRKREILYPPV